MSIVNENKYICPYYNAESDTCINTHCINCRHNHVYRQSCKSYRILLLFVMIVYLVSTYCLYSG